MAKQVIYKINTTIYAVHKQYIDDKINGARITVGKVKTYQNNNGKVEPVIVPIGTKNELNCKLYYIYTDLPKAIKSISYKP